MASSLISGAIALLLIITAGYVIAGGILTIAETTVMTQTEMTLIQEKIRQTELNISANWTSPILTLYILNTGSSSFDKTDSGMDLYLCDGSNVTHRVTSFTPTINNDITNKGFWDPSETLVVTCEPGYEPTWAKFVTSNGITASTNL